MYIYIYIYISVAIFAQATADLSTSSRGPRPRASRDAPGTAGSRGHAAAAVRPRLLSGSVREAAVSRVRGDTRCPGV